MGCAWSKDHPGTNFTALNFDQQTIPSYASSDGQQIRIVENYIILWLVNDSSIDINSMKAQLRRVISTVKTFTDSDHCAAYLKEIRDEKVFLIVPVMDHFLESVYLIPSIEKTYVFDPSHYNADHEIDETSQSTVFRTISSLCEQLQRDVELCDFDLAGVTAAATVTVPTSDVDSSFDLTKEEASFIFAQLMTEITLRLKFENKSKSVFISFCRDHYVGNDEQLQIIDDFEANYRPQKALWWFTRPCFVLRMLHRAQRTQEIDILYKMGFLIKHMHIQLSLLHENTFSVAQNPLIVYRSQNMSSENFNSLMKNKSGGLFSFANFFTANIDKQIAVNLARYRLATLHNRMTILFEIHVDTTMHSTRNPFALLDHIQFDNASKKGEILFSLGTIFCIESVEQTTDNLVTMWIVRLTFIHDDDERLLRLLAPLRKSEIHTNPLSYMGRLLIEMGEYERAEKFFFEILRDVSVRSQPHRLVRVHNGLGAISAHKGDQTKAIAHYQQALEVSLSYLPREHPDRAHIYNMIGNSYFKQGDYAHAVYNYEQAAELVWHNMHSNNHQFITSLHSRINSARQLLAQNK